MHTGRYKHKWTISVLLAEVGKEGEEMKKFNGFLKLLVEFVVNKGSRDMRCPWADFEKTLQYNEKAALQILYPTDDTEGRLGDDDDDDDDDDGEW